MNHDRGKNSGNFKGLRPLFTIYINVHFIVFSEVIILFFCCLICFIVPLVTCFLSTLKCTRMPSYQTSSGDGVVNWS